LIVIPAIDLKDGKCVRLRQGKFDDQTVFSQDPIDVACTWLSQGAERLHLVDLSGALEGKPVHGDIIQSIVKLNTQVPVQVGGGIRDLKTIEYYLGLGISQVILGTIAVNSPEFVAEACRAFPSRVIVGIDARNGFVATHGWEAQTTVKAQELAKKFESDGVFAIIYTDIARDGMMQGVNLEATHQLAQSVSIPIIASGGVSQLSDIEGLLKLSNPALYGVIAGRSLYEQTLSLAEAVALCRSS
jgi:phosphoribosylformimino-5-aminoimidazole carboxamide ribotide isomerase